MTTAAGTGLVGTARDSFTCGTNLALLSTASASNTFPDPVSVSRTVLSNGPASGSLVRQYPIQQWDGSSQRR